jgi:tRNA U55 pseudouridine synthase TruB
VIAEWGRLLGTGAVMERLVRTRAGSLSLEESVDLESLRRLAAAGRAAEGLVPAARALAHLPEAKLDDAAAARLLHGQSVPDPRRHAVPASAGSATAAPENPNVPVRLTIPGGRMIGIGRLDAGTLFPLRTLPPGESLP